MGNLWEWLMGGLRKFGGFQAINFRKTFFCPVSYPTFGIGRLNLWEKEEGKKIIGKKRKRRSIRVNVDLYEVFLSFIIYFLLFYIMTILIPFFSDLWHLSHQGKVVQEVLATIIRVGKGKRFR